MKRLASFSNTMSFSVKLDPKYIIKQGYLTKSPPLHDRAIIKRRWRLRWFVLYDNGAEDVFLYYFDRELSVSSGRAKGKISLVGAEVYKQRGRLHGYSYVINIQTNDRLYHLCSTQETVHEAWLDKIRDHYIPSTEVHQRRLTMLENQLMQPRPSLMGDTIGGFHRTPSVVSNRSVTSNSDDEVDYREKEIDDDEKIKSSCKTLPRDLHRIHGRPCPIPPDRPPILKEFTPRDDDDDKGYVTMVGETTHTTHSTKSSNVESEDEGIGRSDSDSSNASTSRRPVSLLTSPNYLPSFNSLRTAALRNSMDQLLDGFVGPKILTPRENRKELPQRKSVGDLDLIYPCAPPRTIFTETEKTSNTEKDNRFSSYNTRNDTIHGDF